MHQCDAAVERLYQIHDLSIAAKQWGTGKPCLALHGWLDNAASFDVLAPMLPGSNVIAIDFPGHGLSSHRPPTQPYHFVDYVKDVAFLVKHLGFEKIDLIGHSMGGGVAALLAAVMPDSLDRVVLLESVGALTTSPPEAPQQLRRGITDLLEADLKKPPVYDVFEQAVHARTQGGFGVTPATASLLCHRGLEKVDGRFHWRSDPKLIQPSLLRLSESQLDAFMSAIRVPVCFILAEEGIRQTHGSWVESRLEAFSSARLEVLKGGHHFHMERAAGAMAEIIQAFLHE